MPRHSRSELEALAQLALRFALSPQRWAASASRRKATTSCGACSRCRRRSTAAASSRLSARATTASLSSGGSGASRLYAAYAGPLRPRRRGETRRRQFAPAIRQQLIEGNGTTQRGLGRRAATGGSAGAPSSSCRIGESGLGSHRRSSTAAAEDGSPSLRRAAASSSCASACCGACAMISAARPAAASGSESSNADARIRARSIEAVVLKEPLPSDEKCCSRRPPLQLAQGRVSKRTAPGAVNGASGAGDANSGYNRRVPQSELLQGW